METWQAISTYRAIRAFADRPLQRDAAERIVRAGRRAPSSKNRQRWAFVVVQDRDRLKELSGVGPYAGHVENAGAAVALLYPLSEDGRADASTMLDLGQAVQNMLLAAWDLGIGGVHASVYDEDVARRVIGYPRDYRCDLLLSFGYPADDSLLSAPPRKGGRRPLGEVVRWERW